MSERDKFTDTQTIHMMATLGESVRNLHESIQEIKEPISKIPVALHRLNECEGKLKIHSGKLDAIGVDISKAKGVTAILGMFLGAIGGYLSSLFKSN